MYLSETRPYQRFSINGSPCQNGQVSFTTADFACAFHISKTQAKYLLRTRVKHGLFIRLRRGLYILGNHLRGKEKIAGPLYAPSYISLEYALRKYKIISGTSNMTTSAITSVTTRLTRQFLVGKSKFTYHKIKKKAFAGYTSFRKAGYDILIAEPEKALVDYLYLVSLGRRRLPARLNLRNVDHKKVLMYARLYERPSLIYLIAML